MKHILKRILIIILVLLILAGAAVTGINWYVKSYAKERIISSEQAAKLGYDCVLVLGAGVWADNTPSPMLADRLERGVELYEQGAGKKLLMSGDHGTEQYDEVNVMKNYALDAGVAEQDVFLDHAGFSTYESLYRAKEIYGVETVVIVTQSYHLSRAVFIAEQLGMTARGVASDQREYANQSWRDMREILARVKDFFMVIFKPEPTYLGEAIPISGSGVVTNG